MKTALLQEDPVVVVISKQTTLTTAFSQTLRKSGYQSIVVDFQTKSWNQDCYKTTILLSGVETNEDVRWMVAKAIDIQKPTLVCIPYLPKISTLNKQLQLLWDHWYGLWYEQILFIASNLPTAQMILIDGWVDDGNTPILSLIQTVFAPLSQGFYWQTKTNQQHLLSKEVYEEIIKGLGRPGVGSSMILRNNLSQGGWEALIQKIATLYEVYYRKTIVPTPTPVELSDQFPFEIQIKHLSSPSSLRGSAEFVLKQLGSPENPSLFWVQDVITTKTLVVQENTREVIQNNQNEDLKIQSQSPETVQNNDHKIVEHPTPQSADRTFANNLETIFKNERVKDKEKYLKNVSAVDKKTNKQVARNKTMFVIGTISSTTAILLLVFFASAYVSSSLLRQKFIALASINQLSSEYEQQLSDALQFSQFVSPQVNILEKVIDSSFFSETTSVIASLEKMDQIAIQEQKTSKTKTLLLNYILGQPAISPNDVLLELETDISSSQLAYSELSSLLNSLPAESKKDEGEVTVQEWVEKQENENNQLLQLLPTINTLFGFNRENTTYAVLFMNASELRPTGGFIQSVGIVSLQNGQLSSFSTLASYDIDKKIGGVIDPPEDLKKLLEETSWFFRDSNWDPDGEKSAQRALWFLEKALGKQFDGVITLPSSALAEILKNTKPLSLPKYNESLSDKNLHERMLFHSDLEFSESTKNYPSLILDTFLKNIFESSSQDLEILAPVLLSLLSDGELQMFLANTQDQDWLSQLRWSGSPIVPTCPTQFSGVFCLADTIYQTESNIGVNQVNSDVSRSVNHTVALKDGEIVHSRSTMIKNNATSGAWPSGPYSAYLRWNLPKVVQGVSISINDVVVPPEEVVLIDQNEFFVYGTKIQVPIQTELRVAIHYQIPITQSSPLSYFLFDQKQPSVMYDSYDIQIQYPEDSKVVRIAPSASIEGSQAKFSHTLGGHMLTAIELK